MKYTRRVILALTGLITLSFWAVAESNARTVGFTPAAYKSLVKSGKPFMLGVHTDWCSTCDRQKRVIGALRTKGTPYKGLTVMEMDWDQYRGSKIGRQLRIPRRSTLIMYSKGREVGRIIAGTSQSSIKKLIDKGY